MDKIDGSDFFDADNTDDGFNVLMKSIVDKINEIVDWINAQ